MGYHQPALHLETADDAIPSLRSLASASPAAPASDDAAIPSLRSLASATRGELEGAATLTSSSSQPMASGHLGPRRDSNRQHDLDRRCDPDRQRPHRVLRSLRSFSTTSCEDGTRHLDTDLRELRRTLKTEWLVSTRHA